ncbi:helix-turn-helix domain-containing protein [Caulobacter sp. UNC279MFTsu5.1]|uniref:helix-turn-helix domain-containing protein n=1 Tax=Caulobacter sp. UNC279MFTsu5.1 TaxID=1502775 RepID=UPI0021008092|nr:helix-turn-helix domain-containing protein [Caulobacter sp. UNC279MFTsu5.1]
MKEPHLRSWSNAGWRQVEPGGGDPAEDGLVAGTLDEQRSFGARAAVALGHVVVRETQGPHEVWAHADGRDLAITQLTPEPCRGHLLRANLGDMGFDAGAFDGDLRVRGVMARKAFSLVSVMEQEGVLNQWGHRVEEGDIVAIPPGGELDGRFQGRVAYAVVTAPWGLVMQRAEAFEWLADPCFWTEPAVYSPPPEARAACKRVLQGCSGMLRALGAGVPSGAVAFLRDELLDGVLTALAAVRVEGGRRQGVLNAARIVRGAEDFLESGGARQVVQIEDLCLALNISRRTLYRAFRDLLDISPKAYLRLKNMSAARARLLEAGVRPTTVTQVALDQGFWELGRFSGAYRAMFGESPSETLRAAQGDALRR